MLISKQWQTKMWLEFKVIVIFSFASRMKFLHNAVEWVLQDFGRQLYLSSDGKKRRKTAQELSIHRPNPMSIALYLCAKPCRDYFIIELLTC